ncbi:MAG: Mur ligase family protein [Candidatus Gracilibacteria bacterium]
MDFEAAKRFLESLVSYENLVKMKYDDGNFDLRRVRDFLDELGVDIGKMKFVHVAGSKGKGTVATMVAEYLRISGRKTGLFTSPWFLDMRESFWVDGKLISKKDFVRLVGKVKKMKIENLTYFEVLTGLVLKYFQEKKVEYAVLEVGLGGRLDATNVVTPVVSALTMVEKEHTAILGKTYRKILREKLGIKKAGVPMVIGWQKNEVRKLIPKKEMVFVNKKAATAKEMNADTAREILKVLLGKVEGGLFKRVCDELKMMGRFEVVKTQKKTVVFDMAHTEASVSELLKNLKRNFKNKKFVFLVSLMKDKNVGGILKLIRENAERLILTVSHPARSFQFKKMEKNPKKAFERALGALKKDEILVVTGSHFLVALLRRFCR